MQATEIRPTTVNTNNNKNNNNMNMTNGLPSGLQLTITNNGNRHRTMTPGTPRSPVNISLSVIAEVTHTLDHNPMVTHHRLVRHPGTVVGITGMRITAGMIHHGEGLSHETPCVAYNRFCALSRNSFSRDFSCDHDVECRYGLL